MYDNQMIIDIKLLLYIYLYILYLYKMPEVSILILPKNQTYKQKV